MAGNYRDSKDQLITGEIELRFTTIFTHAVERDFSMKRSGLSLLRLLYREFDILQANDNERFALIIKLGTRLAASGSMNKTQRLALFVWNSWKGKPAAAGRFVPAKRKSTAETLAPVIAKKSELELPRLRRNTVKLTQADRQDLISSTQHLDACFSTMWRRAV